MRIRSARRLLEEEALPIGAIAARLGFPDIFAFSRYFTRVEGISPRAWREDRRARYGGRG